MFEHSITTCGSSRSSGPGSATRTSRPAGSSPGTTAGSTRPARTGGCSATAKAAPTCTSSSGPTSSDTRSSWHGASPDDPALADYWAEAAAQGAPADRQDQPVAPQSPGRSLRDLQGRAPARRRPATNPARVGAVADGRPQGDRQGRHPAKPPSRTNTNPVSHTSAAATAAARHFCPPTSLRGLLEPGARKRARPGSEGGRAQQCVRPTRPFRQRRDVCKAPRIRWLK